MARLTSERDEAARAAADLQRRRSQAEHEARRKERDFERLQGRLRDLLSEQVGCAPRHGGRGRGGGEGERGMGGRGREGGERHGEGGRVGEEEGRKERDFERLQGRVRDLLSEQVGMR